MPGKIIGGVDVDYDGFIADTQKHSNRFFSEAERRSTQPLAGSLGRRNALQKAC